MTSIGKSAKRIDAYGKVTGQTLYPGDINFEDQAHMKILFAHRPHAVVKSVNTKKAESLAGVLLVLTAKDVPVNEYGLMMNDQPVLCGPGSEKEFTDRVRFVGDQVAVVVAETEAIAAQARDLITVEYQDLPVLTDPEAAMQPDAVLLHPDHGSNVVLEYKIRKGDVEAGFAKADVIVQGEYRTPAQEHAYLAPEAGLAYYDEDECLTIAVAGQWIHEEQEQIAHALGLPLDQVRVIHPAIGGAFGGREDMSVQIVLALAVLRLKERGEYRPVKIVWSREESIIGHHKRHPYLIRAKWGATKDGVIVAAESEVIADGGAYNYTSTKVLGNATFMVSGPYEIEHVKVDSQAVYTNNNPSGAFRGFGGPQGAFAAEMQINKIAAELGLDPVDIRMKNVVRDDVLLHTQTPLPSPVTLDRVIEACAKSSLWMDGAADSSQPHLKRGVGFAAGFKNVGFSFGFPENSWAKVEIHGDAEIEKVVLYQAGSDVGQGAHTVFRQMAAEAVGVELDKVQLMAPDSKDTQNSGSASASRLTFMAGNAIKGAGERALEMWQDEDRPAVAEFKYEPPRTTPLDSKTGKGSPNFAYGYVAEVIEVEVDTKTGHVRLVNVVCADDVGKALNPQQIEGQIEGAVIQAGGYLVLENFIQQDGIVLTDKFSNYLIPTVLDIPEKVESIILEFEDSEGPWGARGMAEMPFIPLAPAVMAAVHQATGVWFDEFPLTPERVLRGLGILES